MKTSAFSTCKPSKSLRPGHLYFWQPCDQLEHIINPLLATTGLHCLGCTMSVVLPEADQDTVHASTIHRAVTRAAYEITSSSRVILQQSSIHGYLHCEPLDAMTRSHDDVSRDRGQIMRQRDYREKQNGPYVDRPPRRKATHR